MEKFVSIFADIFQRFIYLIIFGRWSLLLYCGLSGVFASILAKIFNIAPFYLFLLFVFLVIVVNPGKRMWKFFGNNNSGDE